MHKLGQAKKLEIWYKQNQEVKFKLWRSQCIAVRHSD